MHSANSPVYSQFPGPCHTGGGCDPVVQSVDGRGAFNLPLQTDRQMTLIHRNPVVRVYIKMSDEVIYYININIVCS